MVDKEEAKEAPTRTITKMKADIPKEKGMANTKNLM